MEWQRFGMLGLRRGTTRWAYDTVRRRERWCQQTGQEAVSPSEGSLMEGGADMGDGNNSFITISDRAYDRSSH